MRQFVLVLSVVVLGAFVGIAVTSHAFLSVSAQNGFKAHSLLTASVSDVQNAAVDYAASESRVLAPPQIILTRSITKQELPALELSEIGYGDHDPPLAADSNRGASGTDTRTVGTGTNKGLKRDSE